MSINFKGTIRIILQWWQLAMPDSQRYPWNLELIQNVEDTVIFLILEKCVSPSLLLRSKTTTIENRLFKETKTLISNFLLDQTKVLKLPFYFTIQGSKTFFLRIFIENTQWSLRLLLILNDDEDCLGIY